MRHGLRRLLWAVGTAMILVFFSEFYFLNLDPESGILIALRENPWHVLSLTEFILYYALFAYWFLFVLYRFRVQSLDGLFLAGAIFGWLTEAVIVPIVYEAMPLSFLHPSLTWHALIDVVLGWYFVRRVMQTGSFMAVLGMFVVLGMAWGSWATWFWIAPEAPEMTLTTGEFAVFALVSSSVWIGGMVLVDSVQGAFRFEVSKWELGIIGVITVVFAALMALPYLPFGGVLWVIAVFTVWVLSVGRDEQVGKPIADTVSLTDVGWMRYLVAFLTPLIAACVYAVHVWAGVGIPTEDILFVLLVVAGGWYVVAVGRRLYRRILVQDGV